MVDYMNYWLIKTYKHVYKGNCNYSATYGMVDRLFHSPIMISKGKSTLSAPCKYSPAIHRN